ncbi:hypothetical protein CH275_03115 [Rhodococcus sp. 06-235-1A]|uniref:DUF6941 family protein n=1 Tax=Rhodococcus sp. 06-235-1A TaxID=2022508 RepID=UPI000B9B2D6B|nr:hypothetical protein [Rhodococcus sp. 06-235-1A]OZD09228.1 hypothetical protein CH275_03115 [Rhodococcus sp. 06-235-1A]
MKFTTFMLVEHTTVVSGLVNVLGGGASHLNRPSYPAPMALSLLCMIQPPPSYQGEPIQVLFTVTEADGDAIYARLEGEFGFGIHAEADPRTMNAPLVVDLSDVMLPKSGLYRIAGTLDNSASVELFFQVKTVDVAAADTPLQ